MDVLPQERTMIHGETAKRKIKDEMKHLVISASKEVLKK